MTNGLGGRLLYSQCWEDLACARAALRIRPGDRVLAIAAAGDNVLGLLLDDPASIVAVDLNPAQTALVELKAAALRDLAGDEIDAFIGLRPSRARWARYRGLRAGLSPAARSYWDGERAAIEQGLLHAGRFEAYVGRFRRAVLPIAPGRGAVRRMLRAPDVEQQARLYADEWDTRRWRLLFRAFFSRRLLALFGRHPAFFDLAPDADVGRHFLERVHVGLTATPITMNPYMVYLLSGSYGPAVARPDYLRREHRADIVGRLERVDLRTAHVVDVLRGLPDSSIDAFYLSDIFELFEQGAYEAALTEIARVGRPGARLCYWNNLVRRRRPESLRSTIHEHRTEAAALHRADRAFLYSRLVVESVAGDRDEAVA
jgi:S-adenosylmethionine-diacylglycerol 3-amino-3-carboxypropyl transferase